MPGPLGTSRKMIETDWRPPGSWTRLKTIESHAAGEPLRIVTEGWPEIPGKTMLSKRRYAKKNHDHLRRILLREPRGHTNMYGAIMTEPVTNDGDLGVLFVHNEGFSTMCGHGVIALVTSLIETGKIPADGPNPTIRLDTPAGRVTAKARIRGGMVKGVAFENVPSFVYAKDRSVEVEGIGPLRYDVVFGGAFYAYCRAEDLKVELVPRESRRIVELGMRVKLAVMKQMSIRHPVEDDLGFLYGTIISGKAGSASARIRNVCVFADGQIDRSPTGTGVSGHVALEYDKKTLKIGRRLVVESILGTRFKGRALRTTTVGEYAAVVPEIEGSAWTSGRSEFWLDPSDPIRDGFIIE
ncbi:MAG: proline racemase family protein [Thaumarchaeota archaeon]|nr:proline racemase family protein [Nitrososphaerota archaeon]